jgi:hypothetical protein
MGNTVSDFWRNDSPLSAKFSVSSTEFGFKLNWTSFLTGAIATFSVAALANKSNFTSWNNKDLHNLFSSPYIISAIKSRMRWAAHVARAGEMRNAHNISPKNHTKKRLLGRLRLNVKIILRYIFRKQRGRVWTEFIWLRIGTSGGIL